MHTKQRIFHSNSHMAMQNSQNANNTTQLANQRPKTALQRRKSISIEALHKLGAQRRQSIHVSAGYSQVERKSRKTSSSSVGAKFGTKEPKHGKRGKTIRLGIVGQEKSGKSALAVRLVANKFLYEYSSLPRNIKTDIHRNWNGIDHEIEVLDFCTKQACDVACLKKIDCAIILYDCTRLADFKTVLDKFVESEMLVPIYLVGNKYDLEVDNGFSQNESDSGSTFFDSDREVRELALNNHWKCEPNYGALKNKISGMKWGYLFL